MTLLDLALPDFTTSAQLWLLTAQPYLVWLSGLIVVTGIFQNAVYLLQLLVAGSVIQQDRSREDQQFTWWALTRDVTVPVALLVPAYNEELSIVETVNALMAVDYPSLEVIVINDGSTDTTLERLKSGFRLRPAERAFEAAIAHQPIRKIYISDAYPGLVVIDKANGGKADAMNAGINVSRAPLFCVVDADSLLEADALLRAVKPFITDPDHVVASGGSIRLVNGCRVKHSRITAVTAPRNLLALFQAVEYLRAFLMARLALAHFGVLLIISGAFGVIRRDVAVQVGGYSSDTMGEDFEVIVKMMRYSYEHRKGYRVCFIPEPVCWTEAPEDLAVLARQRRRWQRGALETLWKHRRMLGNPRYGRIGLVAMPLAFISDVLTPILEGLGYILIPLFWLAGVLSSTFFLAWLAVVFGFGMVISVGALILEELELRRFQSARDLLWLATGAVLENFGYRQLNNLWRIQATWQYVRRKQVGWGQMTRQGFRS
jgi:cellulose synthase/poly-beta-1,6-N-acetylglucosamine synthase-like glycosyltransferase